MKMMKTMRSVLAALVLCGGFSVPAFAMLSNGSTVDISEPLDCSKATITGDEFLDKIYAITMHGDLTDIPFIEKTLGAKFEPRGSNGFVYIDTDRSYREDYYVIHPLCGLPIKVDLAVKVNQNHRSDSDSIAHMQLSGGGGGIRNCLGIASSEFDAKFGHKFQNSTEIDDVGSLERSAGLLNVGKEGVKMRMIYSYRYNQKDGKIVDSIFMEQKP